MTDLIEPLKELARRWRNVKWARTHHSNPLPSEMVCAEELESLLPALEKILGMNAAQHLEEKAALQMQIAALKEDRNKLLDIQAEYADFKTLMACSHPKACMSISAEPPEYWKEPRCRACEQLRLERAALREAIIKEILEKSWIPLHMRQNIIANIREDSDKSFAETHDAEVIDSTLEIYERAFEQNWVVQDTIDAIRAMKRSLRGHLLEGQAGNRKCLLCKKKQRGSK